MVFKYKSHLVDKVNFISTLSRNPSFNILPFKTLRIREITSKCKNL